MKLSKELDKQQISKIKKLYEKAFPLIERKPFSLIQKKCSEGSMELFSIEDECGFAGLAVTILHRDMVLLDYFAIAPERRGKGAGSKALVLIQQQYADKRLLLEIENTEGAADNQDERLRRKAFYLRHGMSAMPFHVSLFGVEMEILCHNCEITFPEYHDIFVSKFGSAIAGNVKLVPADII